MLPRHRPPLRSCRRSRRSKSSKSRRSKRPRRSLAIAIGVDETEYSDTDPSALTEFKPTLENHGAWVDDAADGTVWVPAKEEVGADFQPYVSAGHWTYSDETDYVWVSDYSWGWAPFHYGRWVYLPAQGWGGSAVATRVHG